MKIGLVRHFKVNLTEKRTLSSKEYLDWSDAYDTAEVFPFPVDLKEIQWQVCYVSDLKRAQLTAKSIFKGPTFTTPLLREVRNYPVFQTNKRLFHRFWSVVGRAAWFFNHPSQGETRRDTLLRIESFLKCLDEDRADAILIVSHGFFMHSLVKVLLKRGFVGPSLGLAENGVLYVYESNRA